jgi:hypothetical protein
VSQILFLMAEAVKRNFADPGERRWRLTAAYEILAGRRPTAKDAAAIEAELGK